MLVQFRRLILIYGKLFVNSLRTITEYRGNFLVSLIGVVLLNGANIVQILVIGDKFGKLGSWKPGELMLLYGFFLLTWSLQSVFFSKISKIEELVTSGEFDSYFLKPVSPFLQLISGDIRYTGLCDTFLGILLCVSGTSLLDLTFNLISVFWCIIFIVSGGVIVVCIRLMISCSSFFITKTNALSSFFTQVYLITQKYPISIFNISFRFVVTFILPVAYINYYPVSFLLGKTDVSPYLCMSSPIVALGFVIISSTIWKIALRHYDSSGG